MRNLRCSMSALLLVVFAVSCRPSENPPLGDDIRSEEAPTGELQLREGEFRPVSLERGVLMVRAGLAERTAAVKPWSAWWLPVNSPYLFQGTPERPAPLEKFDQFSKKVGVPKHAAEFERQHIYDPNAISWEGSCDAWALASLLEPEPTSPITVEGISFSVGDQKALLVKSYEQTEGKKVYGQPFQGTRGSVYDDLYPEEFHLFVQSELIEQGRPFILDKDPGIAVWNTPIWRAIQKVEEDPQDPSRMHVLSSLWGADPWVPSYDAVGTRTLVLEYSYDLWGVRQPDGSLKVAFGVWTDIPAGPHSTEFHPDFVVRIPDRVLQRSSRNEELDSALVDRIRTRSGAGSAFRGLPSW